MTDDFTRLTHALSTGGVAVVRTDTLYGIIALSANESAVEKVYRAKHRDPTKQCIVLIADAESISKYADDIAAYSKPEMRPTSVVVPASNEPGWLLRGGNSIAYRVVRDPFLKRVVEAVGPVIAPSANPEGLAPARAITEAKEYFGDQIDCYVDGGEVPVEVPASRIVEVLRDGATTIIRP